MKQLSKSKVKERRKKGTVKAYTSRAAAIRKLQIPLADFRRLCILKGVYPVEPKNKSKLTGGETRRKTYFFTRDIQSLMNEPLLEKFWEFKKFMKRLTRAKGRHDLEKFQQVNESKPTYQLDSLVKERYPRFLDALRDCDDALSMCFLYSMLANTRNRPEELIDQSRKVTLEFMHYIMHSRCLRKVFISVKGYYYQAEIMGQKVTWIVPHQFVIDNVKTVDMNILKTFTEFYITLMGFINYKLFSSINAIYPPSFVNDNINDLTEEDYKHTVIASLNKKLKFLTNKSVVQAESADQRLDNFDNELDDDKDETKKPEDQRMTLQQTLSFENLFKGLKFFLNREVPRESLTFVIRSFGGQVSWDKTSGPGSTFNSKDTNITHHIVDRPSLSGTVLGRVYVQPQWVFDCVNMRSIIPTGDYLIGSTLPPHRSPFVGEKRDQAPVEVNRVPAKKPIETNKSNSRSRMSVKEGKVNIVDRDQAKKEEEAENRKMGIMMIPKRKKRLFDKITKTQRERSKKADVLSSKRRIVEAIKKRNKR